MVQPYRSPFCRIGNVWWWKQNALNNAGMLGRTFQAWDTRRSFIKAGRIWSSIIDTPNDIQTMTVMQRLTAQVYRNWLQLLQHLKYTSAQMCTVFHCVLLYSFCRFLHVCICCLQSENNGLLVARLQIDRLTDDGEETDFRQDLAGLSCSEH